MAPDDTNNRMDIDIPDQTWTAVDGCGHGSGHLLLGHGQPDER